MKTTPQYLKTSDMAKMIGYSKDYLLRNRGILFFEGDHFFMKKGRTNWKVARIIEWIENKTPIQPISAISEKIA